MGWNLWDDNSSSSRRESEVIAVKIFMFTTRSLSSLLRKQTNVQLEDVITQYEDSQKF